MKKIISICLSFLLIFCMIPSISFATENATLVLTGVSDGNKVEAGDKITVTATIPKINSSIANMTVNVGFDKTLLEVNALTLPTKISGKTATCSSVDDANRNGFYGVTVAESDNFSMVESIVLQATFSVKNGVELKNYDKAVYIVDSGNQAYLMSDEEGAAVSAPEFKTKIYALRAVSKITSVAITGAVAPVKGAAPVSSVETETGTTAKIEWYAVKNSSETKLVSGNFAGDTQYKAVINVKPTENYLFASSMSFTVDGDKNWTAVKQSDGSYNLTKTFDKTASKSITALAVTTQPTKKSYTHGDAFDAAGMVVKATYDDESVDAAFKDYTVSYATEGKTYLKYNDTEVTLKAGNVTAKVSGLTVGKKELEITGLKATDRKYDGTTNVALTGGQLAGAVAGEKVAATVPANGTVADANVGAEKAVTVTTPDLTGDDAGCYTLKAITGIKVDITAADIPEAVAAAITGYNGAYDAQKHNAVNIGENANGYTVTYADSQNGTYSSDVPTITDAGNKTVWVKISKENYADKVISVKATVTPKTLTADDLEYTGTITKEYDGTTICDVKSVKVKSASAFSQDITVAGTAAYNKAGVDATKVVFTADGIATGNYRLASGTALDITASITATSKYIAADKYNTQNVVKGIGAFAEPVFTFNNETVKGTFEYTLDNEAKTKDEIVEILKAKNAGETASIKYTFTPSAGTNFTGTKTGTIDIKMIDIEFKVGDEAAEADNAVTIKNNAPVYGTKWSDIVVLKNNVSAKVGDTVVEGKYTLSVDSDAVPEAGAAEYNILFTSKDGQYDKVKVFATDASVQVSQKQLNVTGAKATDRQYDGTNAIAVTEGTLRGVVGDDAVTLGGTPAGTIENADAGNKKAVTVTGYTISGNDVNNYTLIQPTDVTVNIAKKELTLKSVTIEDKTFDGTVKATVTAIEFNEATPLPDTSGYAATAEFKDAKVGTEKDVTVKIVLNDANYNFAEKTVVAKANITKATLTIPTQKLVLKAGDTTGQTIDLTSLMPKDAGELTYGGVDTKGSDDILQKIDLSEGKLKFQLKKGTEADKTGTLSVTISSENYADVIAAVEVKTTAKDVPAVTVENITVEYTGEAVSKDLIKGTHSVDGTFDWATKTTVPTNAGSGSYEVTFTPSDSTKYEAVTKTVKVTIKPAKVTGTLTFDKVTAAGSILGDITPEDMDSIFSQNGTFVWNDGSAQAIEQGKAYGWTFTPNDTNYEVLTGTVVPWAASSSGGGGGAIVLPDKETPEKTAKTFIAEKLTAGGAVFNAANKDNYKAILEVVEAYDKLSAEEKTALDKELKAQTGKTFAELKTEAEKVKAELEPVEKTVTKADVKAVKVKAKSKAVKLNGKKAIKISWYITEGELKAADFDGFAVYKSTKKNSGYGKPCFYTTKLTYTNNKGLKTGKTYYYKIRAYKVIDGVKVFTDYSTKAWRTIK